MMILQDGAALGWWVRRSFHYRKLARRLQRFPRRDFMNEQPRQRDAMLRLIEDHRRVQALFEKAEGDASLFEQIEIELDAHARVEEQLFYPAAREALSESERERVDMALEDHEDVKETLRRLSKLPREGEEFREALQDLRDSVLQHIEEEEDELFPRVRAAMTPELLAELGGRIDSLETELVGGR